MPMTRVLRDFPRPDIAVHPSEIGMRIIAKRDLGDDKTHVRVTNLLFPQAFVIPMSEEMTITQWHVPIDDTSCYWYAIFTSFTAAVDKAEMRRQRLQLYTLPDYKPRLGLANDYGFDTSEQQSLTYTGMGEDINLHDQWAVESQGPIQDRTREHLGQSDRAIVTFPASADGRNQESDRRGAGFSGTRRRRRRADNRPGDDGWNRPDAGCRRLLARRRSAPADRCALGARG